MGALYVPLELVESRARSFLLAVVLGFEPRNDDAPIWLFSAFPVPAPLPLATSRLVPAILIRIPPLLLPLPLPAWFPLVIPLPLADPFDPLAMASLAAMTCDLDSPRRGWDET